LWVRKYPGYKLIYFYELYFLKNKYFSVHVLTNFSRQNLPLFHLLGFGDIRILVHGDTVKQAFLCAACRRVNWFDFYGGQFANVHQEH
jgi:hypothetical protein